MSRKRARIPTAQTLLTNGVEDELKKELFREIYYRYRSEYRLAVRKREQERSKGYFYAGVPVGMVPINTSYGC